MMHLQIKYLLGVFLLGFIGCTTKNQGNKIESRNSDYDMDIVNIRKNAQDDSVKIDFIASTSIDFGSIRAGDTVKRVFVYKNLGGKPFVIHGAMASCGCTVAYYNEQPLEVGGVDSISVVFISDEKMKGFKSKVVTIDCNSPLSPFLLTLRGRIE